MKGKRVAINIIVITLIFLIFSFWYENYIRGTIRTTSNERHRYKVYLITVDKSYQYWDILNEGASDMAASIGVNYIWDAPEVRNVNEQIEVIKRAVNNGANALLVAADDPKMISEVIEDAKAQSIRVVYVDSPAYEEAITTLATNNYEAGVISGQKMLSLLDKLELKSGSIGIISIPEKSNTELREKGFRDVLDKDGRFTLLDTVYTNGDAEDAKNATQEVIERNKDLVALYGTNEPTSMGVGFANRDNGNKFAVVGFDDTDVMRQLLKEGSINAIIAQNPYSMGYLGMAQAVAALMGKDTGPSFLDTGVRVLE